MPIGLTGNALNILDAMHFKDDLMSLLPEDAMTIFDNRAHSRNSGLLDSLRLGFVTHLQLNATSDAFVKAYPDD